MAESPERRVVVSSVKETHWARAGMRTASEVAENVRVLERPRDEGLVAQIEALVAPVRNRTWHEGLDDNAPT